MYTTQTKTWLVREIQIQVRDFVSHALKVFFIYKTGFELKMSIDVKVYSDLFDQHPRQSVSQNSIRSFDLMKFM